MNAVVISTSGAPDVLKLSERAKPAAGADEVLIRVWASGVNRPDVAQRQGVYPPPAGAPEDIPGLEIAGIIEECGSNVTAWKKGDRVCALVAGGGYAEYCLANSGNCLPVPQTITLTEAASMPETFFTVWSNVFDRCKLKQGESLLVHGGSSGIGVTAIQMAKALGCTVYVTAGNDEKCTFCELLGADKAINYRTQSFPESINMLTSGRGVDVILDMVGGDYLPLNIDCLAEEGRLVMINSMKGMNVNIDIAKVMRKRLWITGSFLRSRDNTFKSSVASELKKHIWPLLEQGTIKPVIYKAFPARQAAAAHELMESSRHMGKIVLIWD